MGDIGREREFVDLQRLDGDAAADLMPELTTELADAPAEAEVSAAPVLAARTAAAAGGRAELAARVR